MKLEEKRLRLLDKLPSLDREIAELQKVTGEEAEGHRAAAAPDA